MPGHATLLALALAAAAGPSRVEERDRSVVGLKPELLLYAHYYEGRFGALSGVFCDPASGEIYVADAGLDAIGIFAENGSPLFTFTSDKLTAPYRVVADREGRIYVIDAGRLKVFSYRGEFLSYIDLPPVVDARKAVLSALAIDAEGNLYVGESNSGQVLVLDPARKLKARIGRKGTGRGELTAIVGIASDAENVYVADAEGLAVQVFTRYGRFVRGWGIHDIGAQNVSLPSGLALDPKGRIVLVDKLRQEIKYFESDGRMIDRFGGLGDAPGDVAFPTDVSIDGRGRICVADSGNLRVQVLSVVEAPPRPAAPRPQEPGSPPQ